MSRVEQLYNDIMDRAMKKKDIWPKEYISIIESEDIAKKPLIIRKAYAIKKYLSEMPIKIFPNELIVGMTAQGTIGFGVGFIDYATKKEKEDAAKIGLSIKSVWGHSLPDYKKLLDVGISGIRHEIKKKLELIDKSKNEDIKKFEFYHAVLICYEGFEQYIQRYEELAKEEAKKEKDKIRKKELIEISRICSNIATSAQHSFREALQLLWFTHIALQNTMEYVPIGRFDQYLFPFYEEDIKKGIINDQKVQELIDCFWLKTNDRAQLKKGTIEDNFDPTFMQLGGNFDIVLENDILTNSWHQNVVLSGTNPDGSNATNPLTYMCLEATKKFSLTSPVVTVRLAKNSPDSLIEKCAECIQTGGGYPFIFNDEVIIEALRKLGISDGEAFDYANDGCWETTIPGKTEFRYSNIELLQCLELALNRGKSRISEKFNGPDAGDPEQFFTFDDLFKAFEKQLHAKLEAFIENVTKYYGKVFNIAPDPFFSSLIDDCIEKGKDITEGGARYIFHSPLACGLADVADSLVAIKKLVYEDKYLRMKELLDLLKNNFESSEDLRLLLVNRIPKYGNDEDYVDKVVIKVLESYTSMVNELARKFDGIRFPCGVGTFERYILLGNNVGATPNGRRSGEWIATNCSPTIGSDNSGISSLIHSFAKIDFSRLPTGSPLNLKISPKFAKGENGLQNLKALLRSFIILGCNMLQPIMQDTETLRKAQKEPEKYRNLKVTVGGFQVYFTLLDPKHQEYHIKRIEHG